MHRGNAVQEPLPDLNEDYAARERWIDVDLSVIVVLSEPIIVYPLEQLYEDYKQQIATSGLRYEFIFVVDGDFPIKIEELRALEAQQGDITILIFNKDFGYSAAMSAGFEHASGEILLTLPAYHQIEPEAIPLLLEAIAGSDMVVARRWPRIDSVLNRLQSFVFNYLVKKLGFNFNDLTCGVRVFKRKIIETVYLYGDQHRFFPVLASHYGFKVKEVEVPQSGKDALQSNFRPGVYIRRLLDLLSIFFLVKFTKKPLRFFGLTGLVVFAMGAAFTLFLGLQRLYFNEAIADRPALILGTLLIVLGIQLFAIGLIGELIIFIHARSLKEYTVEKVIRSVRLNKP